MVMLTKILEASAPKRQTQTQQAPSDWESLFSRTTQTQQDRQQNVPAASDDPFAAFGATEDPPQQQEVPQGMSTAPAAQTRAKTAGVQPTQQMADKMRDFDFTEPDEISDDQAAQNAGLDQEETGIVPRKTPENMPAIVSSALEKVGDIVPEWHMVKHLPGYLSSGIRAMGRAVFAPFTSTPIEKIQVLANLMDNGPNEQKEIDAVVGFVTQNGQRNSEAEIQFREKIPDYTAKVQVYMALGYTFLLVKDFAGKYVYAWPSQDQDGLSQGHDGQLGQDRPQLPQQ
jgi:hypothetical protein